MAMEPPIAFDADFVRDEKVKVLRAIAPPAAEEVDERVVRAQYAPGVVGGEPVPGYLQEPGVPPDSTTAITLLVLPIFSRQSTAA